MEWAVFLTRISGPVFLLFIAAITTERRWVEI